MTKYSPLCIAPGCVHFKSDSFKGEEKDSIGQKEEKPDCDSLERLLPVSGVGAQQAEGRDRRTRSGAEAGSSGQHFHVRLPPDVPSF